MTRRSPAKDAAAARVRAAISTATEQRMARLSIYGLAVLRMRSKGWTLSEIAEAEGVSRQAIHSRERMALRKLAAP